MSDIDKEVEVKTTQTLNMIGPYLENDIDDDLGGGSDDYGDLKLTRHRLVSEKWFQGILEEVRASRKLAEQHSDSDSEGADFDTGIPALDRLLQEVFWMGQGTSGGHDAAMIFMEYLDEVKQMIASCGDQDQKAIARIEFGLCDGAGYPAIVFVPVDGFVADLYEDGSDVMLADGTVIGTLSVHSDGKASRATITPSLDLTGFHSGTTVYANRKS